MSLITSFTWNRLQHNCSSRYRHSLNPFNTLWKSYQIQVQWMHFVVDASSVTPVAQSVKPATNKNSICSALCSFRSTPPHKPMFENNQLCLDDIINMETSTCKLVFPQIILIVGRNLLHLCITACQTCNSDFAHFMYLSCSSNQIPMTDVRQHNPSPFFRLHAASCEDVQRRHSVQKLILFIGAHCFVVLVSSCTKTTQTTFSISRTAFHFLFWTYLSPSLSRAYINSTYCFMTI